MTQVLAGMTISLDGFVADASGSPGPLAVDVDAYRASDQLAEAVERTGAVLMGRRTFEMGDPDAFADHYEFQAPIFVVTHQPPDTHPRENDALTFAFVTDGVEPAVARARAAAGSRDVTVVGGPDLIGQLLRARLVDFLELDVVPVLLGSGTPLFAGALAGVPLEKAYVCELGQRTTIGFRVLPAG